jgi:hypothetical protein
LRGRSGVQAQIAATMTATQARLPIASSTLFTNRHDQI